MSVPFTRAGFRSAEEEDEDYCDEENFRQNEKPKEIWFPSVVVRWSPKMKREIASRGHIAAKNVLISHGLSVAGFVESYVLSQQTELIGVICTGLLTSSVPAAAAVTRGTLGQISSSDATNYIYRLKRDTDTVIINMKTPILNEQAVSLVNQVIGSLDPVHLKVVDLSTSSVSSFKTEDPSSLRPPFLRSLVTSSFAHDTSAPYLEKPNILEGLSAAVLTFCQRKRIAAVAYCCYSDIILFDSSVVGELLKLSETSFMKKFVSVSEKAKKQYEAFVAEQQTLTSYVYL